MTNTNAHAGAVLDWYDRQRRDLPWRAAPGARPDPYRVWLSEIMLQQTTVAAVKPYFAAFLDRWPGVDELAAADLDDVLKCWAGLGYYARARNLKACAERVVADHDGRFPSSEAALLALPGIGSYTAAAIAAIAFDHPAVVVDGNIERVIARLFAIETPLPRAKPEIRRMAAGIAPDHRPGDYAQAMMDLGAGICTPKRPACALCPMAHLCAARSSGLEAVLPAKAPKAPRPERRATLFWLERDDGAVLLRRRHREGLLGGMLEVPGTPWDTGTSAPAAPMEHAPAKAHWRKLSGTVSHTFTHFHLELEVRVARAAPDQRLNAIVEPARCLWVAREDLAGEALPSVMRKVVAHATGDGRAARPVKPFRRESAGATDRSGAARRSS